MHILDKLKRMCPNYYLLQGIFGDKLFPPSYDVHDTHAPSVVPTAQENVTLLSPLSFNYDEVTVDNPGIEVSDFPLENMDAVTPTTSISSDTRGNPAKVQRFAEQLKKGAPKTSIDQLSVIQSERNEVQKLKIDFAKEKLLKKTELDERKLLLRELKIKENIERNKEEITLRKLEMEKDERLRALEIDKQERIEKFEIEMRYKYAK